MPGIACDINSAGYKALYNATYEVIGEVKPYSLTGSLPLVHDLQVHIYLIIIIQILLYSYQMFNRCLFNNLMLIYIFGFNLSIVFW